MVQPTSKRLVTEQNLLTPGHPAADGLAATFVAPKAIQIATTEPLATPRLGVNREQARRAYADTLHALMIGTLQTKKADWTAKIQLAAVASSSQTIPEHRFLTAGVADHDTLIADKGYHVTVSAVYNLTADPGRTINRYSSFNRDIQRVNLSSVPTVGDTLEIVGTVHPYQGYWPVAGVAGNLTFEVVEWDEKCLITTNGTFTSIATPTQVVPLVPKLPLPTASSTQNTDYRNNQVSITMNGATGAATTEGDDQQPWLHEGVPVKGQYLNSSGNYDRFRRGARFRMRTTAAQRGVDGTTPIFKLNLPTLNPAISPACLVGLHALVRVADQYADPSGNFPQGRLFLLFASGRTGNGGFPTAGTETGGNFAADLFRIPDDPDYFAGMKVVLP